MWLSLLGFFLPTWQVWSPISKVKADEICPPCHSRSSIVLQQSIVRGKRKNPQLPKCKDSTEPAFEMKHFRRTLAYDSLSKALSQCHAANTEREESCLHQHWFTIMEGHSTLLPVIRSSSQHILPECASSQPKGRKPAVSLLPISNDKHWVRWDFHLCAALQALTLARLLSDNCSSFTSSFWYVWEPIKKGEATRAVLMMKDPFELRTSGWLELNPVHQNSSRYSTW